MSISYGSGGIITKIYDKYKTFENHIKGTYHSLAQSYSLENIYKWNDGEGFHTSTTTNPENHWIELSFEKPFFLTAYRYAMLTNFRFTKSWKVEIKYKDNPYKIVHESNEPLCSKLSSCNCYYFSEKLFMIKNENISLCDTIRITNTGPDTCGTYSLSIGALELYEDESFCVQTQNNESNIKVFLFSVILQNS